MEKGEKKILIAITNQAFAINLVYWANAIEERTDWSVIVYWTFADQRIDDIIRDKNLKRPMVILKKHSSNPLIVSVASRMVTMLEKSRWTKILALPFSIVYEFFSSRALVEEVRGLIRQNRISAVLLPDASPAYFTPEFIAASRKEGVMTVTNPLDRDSPQSYAMLYKSDTTLHPSGLSGWLIGHFYNRWKINYEGKEIFRVRPAKIFAQEFLGIAPVRPWNTFGFSEDMVAVNNEIQRSFYLGTGVDVSKVRVVGSPQLDWLYELSKRDNYRTTLMKELAFENDKPVLLCAIPQTHWIAGRPEAEFQDHGAMKKAWIDCLTAQDSHNILISLHPSMKYEDYKHLDTETCRVSAKTAIELLPLCSIFVANASSTIPFAISLGIPVINYDVYRYSVEMHFLKFNDGEGTITVLNRDEFESVVMKITADSSYYQYQKQKQVRSSSQWGILDGKSIERFIDLIEKLPER